MSFETGEPVDIAKMIASVAFACIFGVVIMSSINTGVLQGSAGNVQMTFSEQPSDGDLFQLDQRIFEYDDDGNYNSAYIPVLIGTTIVDTKNNLLTAIASAGYTVTDHSEVIT